MVDVYYPGHLSGTGRRRGSGRGKRAGKEFPVRASFYYGGFEWYVPAGYLFQEGIVLDICRRIDAGPLHEFYMKWNDVDEEKLSREERMQIELENPAEFSPNFKLTLNGVELPAKSRIGMNWLPFPAVADGCEAGCAAADGRQTDSTTVDGRQAGRAAVDVRQTDGATVDGRQTDGAATTGPRAGEPAELPDSEAASRWMEEHKLPREAAWQFYRVHFPCPGAADETVYSLALTVDAGRREYPCGTRFTAAANCLPLFVPFTHPISGKAYTVRVLECREDVLENPGVPEVPQSRPCSRRGGRLIWPSHFCRLVYRIEPELHREEDGEVRIQDVGEGDSPVRMRADGTKEDETCCAIGVIGGADGPTAISIAGKEEPGLKEEPRTECAFSSVYFEPPTRTEWTVILSYAVCAPEQFDLKAMT